MRTKLLQSISDGRLRRVAGSEGHVLQHSEQHDGYAYVQHSTDNQRGDDPKRQIPLRTTAFLCSSGNRIEADVGEENNRADGDDPAKARRSEGLPVRRIYDN